MGEILYYRGEREAKGENKDHCQENEPRETTRSDKTYLITSGDLGYRFNLYPTRRLQAVASFVRKVMRRVFCPHY
jgi:hypothetical protein